MPPWPRTETIRFLTLDELGRLLAATRDSVRDRALFLLAYRHGLRASEVGLLRGEGDSMIDAGILDGDLIAVRHVPEARNGQIVVARVDGAVTVKVFRRDRHGVHLLPRNPDYAPIEVGAEHDFAIEGLYCGLVRSA